MSLTETITEAVVTTVAEVLATETNHGGVHIPIDHHEAMDEEEQTHALYSRAVLMLGLMVFSIMVINVMKMRNFHAVGETTLYVTIGILVGLAFLIYSRIVYGSNSGLNVIQLSWNFFSLVLLPPIIFEGGFTLQRVTFVRNLVPIMGFALIGGAYSTIVTSTLVYVASRLLYPQFSFIHSLVFGSIISSTDPISVLGMLPPTTDRNLFMMIFGESALNDAVSVILFRFFTQLARSEQEQKLNAGTLLFSFVESVGVFFGSALIGVAVAMVFAKITKHVRPPELPIFQLLIFLVFAYSSYLISDLVGMTGIVGVFFCGAAMAHYSYDNLSKVTILSAKVVLRTISSMCDAFVFIYLGLGLFAFGRSNTTYNAAFIICAFIAILVARSHVFLIGAFYNMFSKATHAESKKIPSNHLTFLWFCGLRGAVSFALAVKVLGLTEIPKDIRALIFGTVVVVVVITVLGMGGMTPYMLKVLKLDASAHQSHKKLPGNDEENGGGADASETDSIKMHKIGQQKSVDGKPQGLEVIKEKSEGSLNTIDEYLPQNGTMSNQQAAQEAEQFMDAFSNGFLITLYELDKRYIKPFFTLQQSSGSMRIQGAAIDGSASTPRRSMVPKSPMIDGKYVELEDEYDQRYNQSTSLQYVIEDDTDDELDRVPLSVAAEMFGIAGSASIALNSRSSLDSPQIQRQ
ncbi:hypothetical protein MP228_002618 [Amoeboaphelidium protococcarum]|nr:hypothetical protein MP228_002618 [Amoeboaphelidium protococcarum]